MQDIYGEIFLLSESPEDRGTDPTLLVCKVFKYLLELVKKVWAVLLILTNRS